jgi:hypothetical protein
MTIEVTTSEVNSNHLTELIPLELLAIKSRNGINFSLPIFLTRMVTIVEVIDNKT